jgi:hypothetical protein
LRTRSLSFGYVKEWAFNAHSFPSRIRGTVIWCSVVPFRTRRCVTTRLQSTASTNQSNGPCLMVIDQVRYCTVTPPAWPSAVPTTFAPTPVTTTTVT